MPKTALSLWTQERWEKSGLSQVPFVKALGLNVNEFGEQTLSKFISGRYKKPPSGLVKALAITYGVAEKELQGYQEQLVTEATSPPSAPVQELDLEARDLPTKTQLEAMIAEHEQQRAFHERKVKSLTWIRDNYEQVAAGLTALTDP